MNKKNKRELGQLTRVDLRDFWEDEAQDFTPWLAEDKNIFLLGDVIGLELDIVGTEKSVGSFKVDILAKDISSDRYVVIENQLEKTNHKHLGQLLTYASGYDAGTVVWIAEKIDDEHRKTLDWLNEKTSDDVAFFGLEIELWKIGDSQQAPKFNLISRPNDWARTIKSTKETQGMTETQLLQKQFWTEFRDYMISKSTNLRLPNPWPRPWYPISIGRANFNISLALHPSHKVSCKLIIGSQAARPAFSSLRKQKDSIESELNVELDWSELAKSSRIIQYNCMDYTNEEKRLQLFEWFKERAEAFHEVFSHRIRNLDIDDEDD